MKRAAPLVLTFISIASCSESDRRVDWEVVVAEDMRDRVVYVETMIVDGDCAMPGRVVYRTEVDLGERGAVPPTLSPGPYAFSATAIDGSCTPLASDCEAVTLPMEDGSQITLTLEEIALPPLCTGARCVDGRCIASDGGVADPCALGARTSTGCIAPSNVPANVLEEIGDTDLLVPEGEWWVFRTDTGAVDAYGAPPSSIGAAADRVVRAAGEGNIAGIDFSLVDQAGESTRLGVFSFESLDVAIDAGVGATGEAALVLLAQRSVEVAGVLSVAAAPFDAPPHPANDWSNLPGPGGAAGGALCSEETRPGEAGLGMGGGGFGAAIAGEPNQGGGGGGGFGGAGGSGGLGEGGIPGGSAGATYGDASLVPLRAGSGGGPGGEADCGKGGAGGGAVQIVAGELIQITGRVDASGAPGGGGRGGTDSGAGGGGGSGGAILLEAPEVHVRGSLFSNGGGGGAGCGADRGSARGASGIHGSYGPSAAGGGGAGIGGAGGAGSDFAGAAAAGEGNQNGGGGGGGGGLIRINVDADGSMLGAALLSPNPASGLLTLGLVPRAP